MLVVKLVLQECEFLAGQHAYAESIAHLPLAFNRDDALVEVCSHIGMHV